MGEKTEIQWCDSTINPTSGCDGCELKVKGKFGTCYAAPVHEIRLAKIWPDKYGADFHEVRTIPGRMDQCKKWSDLTGKDRPDKPWLNGLPRMIFVGDMADIFSKDVPFQFLMDELIATAIATKGGRHIYMILTKNPGRMLLFDQWIERHYVSWPDNIWAGVSVTSQVTEKRAELACQISARTKFLSVEPQLGPIEFNPSVLRGFQLVIQGGESGKKGRPFDLAWARSLRGQCSELGIPYFLKQLGVKPIGSSVTEEDEKNPIKAGLVRRNNDSWLARNIKDSHGGDPSEWPEDLRDCRHFPLGSIVA